MTTLALIAGPVIAAAILAALAADLRLIVRQARWDSRRQRILKQRAADYPPIWVAPSENGAWSGGETA